MQRERKRPNWLWRLLGFLILLIGAVAVWSFVYRSLFGAKAYSVLQVLAAQGSLLVPTLFAAYIAVRYLDRRPFRSFGLAVDGSSGLAFAGGVLLGTMLIAGLYFLGGGPRLQGINPQFSPMLFLAYGAAFLAAAALEEVILRGYLLQTLEEGIGSLPAVILTSLLFVLPHFREITQSPSASFSALELLLSGILLGIGYIRLRTLWFPIGVHFARNFILTNVLAKPFQIRFPNGVLSIDPQSQLLRARWPSEPLPPGGLDYAVLIALYAFGIILLFYRPPWPQPRR